LLYRDFAAKKALNQHFHYNLLILLRLIVNLAALERSRNATCYPPKNYPWSSDEVEQIVALVRLSNLSEEIKPFVIGCINLASWIPRALVEHKITVSNLKRLLFGKGDKSTTQQDKSPKAEENTADAEESEASPSNDESHEPKEPGGYGRLLHQCPGTHHFLRVPEFWPTVPTSLWWQALLHQPRHPH
jgi:hypothetical protein